MAQEFSEDPHSVTLGDLLGAQGTWAEVTENALDMATGHYLFENQQDADIPGFYSSLDLEGRLAATFDLPKKREPGQRVVYLTPNTQACLRQWMLWSDKEQTLSTVSTTWWTVS